MSSIRLHSVPLRSVLVHRILLIIKRFQTLFQTVISKDPYSFTLCPFFSHKLHTSFLKLHQWKGRWFWNSWQLSLIPRSLNTVAQVISYCSSFSVENSSKISLLTYNKLNNMICVQFWNEASVSSLIRYSDSGEFQGNVSDLQFIKNHVQNDLLLLSSSWYNAQ